MRPLRSPSMCMYMYYLTCTFYCALDLLAAPSQFRIRIDLRHRPCAGERLVTGEVPRALPISLRSFSTHTSTTHAHPARNQRQNAEIKRKTLRVRGKSVCVCDAERERRRGLPECTYHPRSAPWVRKLQSLLSVHVHPPITGVSAPWGQSRCSACFLFLFVPFRVCLERARERETSMCKA